MHDQNVQGSTKGVLYVVGTPIGNLSDITLRALETLKLVDWIACEDTRQSLKLLNHYNIQKPLFSIFGPKEQREVPKILHLLEQGRSGAILTDAGTPGISDPGSQIVHAVRQRGFRIEPIPGVSAVACALSVSGHSEKGFVFLGFLHRSKGKIRKELREAAQQKRPLVFYESPFRIVKTLSLAAEILGPQTLCFLAREMTKKFEEYLSGTLAELIEKIKDRKILGEITVILKCE